MTLGAQTKPYGKLLDYEQFIDHQLGRTRTRIKLTDIMTASLTLLVAFLAVLFVEVVLDHVLGLPLLFRRVVLGVGLVGAFTFTAMRVAMPLLRRINNLYAAKTIEDADPAFKNSLINYLELRRHRGQLSKVIMATLEARAVNDLTHVEVDAVVNQQRLMRMAYALSAVIVVYCLYAAFAPKSILESARRAFLADLVRPTNTQLANIKPGSDPERSKVVAGEHVTYFVNVQGIRPQKVMLHYSVDGGKFFALKEFAPGHNMYDAWQTTLTNVQQSMDYYLTGGDAESLRYRLDVLPAPTVSSIAHDLDFPAYTKVERRTNIEGGTVEAIEGTTVTVHARTNMPAALATLNFSSGDPATMAIAVDDSTVLTGRFVVKKAGTYTVNFRTIGGQLNPSPVSYDIYSIPDRPPTARFVQPDRPAIKVPANVKVDLVMACTDDHGVKDATLHVMHGNDNLVSKNLLEGQPPQPEFKTVETLDLAEHALKPGSSLQYWLTARDNKEPSSNKTETARQLIEVIEPASPADKKKFEDSQKKDREQLDPPPPEEDAATEKTPPAEPGKSDEQNPGPSEPGPPKEADQTRPAENKSPGASDTGTAEETSRNPQNGANENQSQLTPQLQREYDTLKQALKQKNQQNPAGNQGSPPGAQQKNNNGASGNAPTPNPSGATGNPDRPNNPADRAVTNPGQRPALETPGQTNPQSAPPPPGNAGSSDASNQVQRGSRDGSAPSTASPQNDSRSKNQPEGKAGEQGGKSDAQSKNQPEGKAGEQGGKSDAQSKNQPDGKAGEQGGKSDAQSKNQPEGKAGEQGGKSDAQSKNQPEGKAGDQGAKSDAQSKNQPDGKAGDQGGKSDAQSKNQPEGKAGDQGGKSDAQSKNQPEGKAGEQGGKSDAQSKNQPEGKAGEQGGKSDAQLKNQPEGKAGEQGGKSDAQSKNQPEGKAGEQGGKSDAQSKNQPEGKAGEQGGKSDAQSKNQPEGKA
ncbi:MAG: hypothetical protein ACHRXM_11825, partial [Isosphaerales bacterium]